MTSVSSLRVKSDRNDLRTKHRVRLTVGVTGGIVIIPTVMKSLTFLM